MGLFAAWAIMACDGGPSDERVAELANEFIEQEANPLLSQLSVTEYVARTFTTPKSLCYQASLHLRPSSSVIVLDHVEAWFVSSNTKCLERKSDNWVLGVDIAPDSSDPLVHHLEWSLNGRPFDCPLEARGKSFAGKFQIDSASYCGEPFPVDAVNWPLQDVLMAAEGWE